MKIMIFRLMAVWLLITTVVLAGCDGIRESATTDSPSINVPATEVTPKYPRLASWLANKDEIIASGKPFDLIMTPWVETEEAVRLKEINSEMRLYAGLTLSFVYDDPGWKTFLLTVASHGRDTPFEITDSMYLRNPDGSRCAFGWASDAWGHGEIWAMDPRNPDWVELIISFYRVVLEQPQHDGIIVDMVLEKSWCPEAISDGDWLMATRAIMEKLQEVNTQQKPVIFNAGCRFSDIDEYQDFFDGYVLENLLGTQCGTDFTDALETPTGEYLVVYAVDTDDTGEVDLDKMRLGLVLSLLGDNTYFAYDFGPRDHGQAWWFPEYDIDLGSPLGPYYEQGGAYRRDFKNGSVVFTPYADYTVVFGEEHTDVTGGHHAMQFNIHQGDGRIFLKGDIG